MCKTRLLPLQLVMLNVGNHQWHEEQQWKNYLKTEAVHCPIAHAGADEIEGEPGVSPFLQPRRGKR